MLKGYRLIGSFVYLKFHGYMLTTLMLIQSDVVFQSHQQQCQTPSLIKQNVHGFCMDSQNMLKKLTLELQIMIGNVLSLGSWCVKCPTLTAANNWGEIWSIFLRCSEGGNKCIIKLVRDVKYICNNKFICCHKKTRRNLK